MKTLRVKIFLLFCLLLSLTLAVVLGTIYTSMREQVQRSINQQLDVGRQVFLTQFESRRRSLSLYSHLIGRDFGLLSTLRDDARSLLVAVNNHRRRASADLAIITDSEGRILADTVRPGITGDTLAQSSLQPGPDDQSLFLTRDGRTFQVVFTDLLAPNPVGRIYLGYLVDNDLAKSFADITALRVAFARSRPRSQELIASTLPLAMADELARHLPAPAGGRGNVDLNGETFVSESVPLSGAGPGGIRAVLLYSEDRAMAAYRPWWERTIEISAVVFLLGLAGAWGVARSVARPLQLLVLQSRAVADGRYEQPITAASGGEIGQLVDEFNRMQGAIAQREESIRFSAYHDSLTGLMNRYGLEQLIDARLGDTQRPAPGLGVLILDLNRFKDINETLGYEAGDRLLKEVSRRLGGVLGARDALGRLGSDEFGIVLGELAPGRLNIRLDEICDAVAQPFGIDGLSVHLTASVGCAMHPDHGDGASILLRRADTACSLAKKKHRRYALYEDRDNRYSLLRVSLLGELQGAMERNNLVLYYQPKFEVQSRRVVGVEALVRWEHPVYGLIPPSEFIPMVEYTGNMHTLTVWVVDEALCQLSRWRDDGIELRMAVNISPDDLRFDGLVNRIRESLDRSGLDPGALTLEVTESAVVDDAPQVLKALGQLNRLGVGLALDDYGTGYSSLGQLKHLPVNELKIDKSFVLNLERSQDDRIIVRSTIEFGHTMGFVVAAEGVETAETQRVIEDLGGDLIQGNHISRPLPAGEFRAWLLARDGRRAAVGEL